MTLLPGPSLSSATTIPISVSFLVFSKTSIGLGGVVNAGVQSFSSLMRIVRVTENLIPNLSIYPH